jgi:putative Holliday junction resolvase
MREGVALGFDYGKRRVGIAVGSPLTGRDQPLTTLEHSDGQPDWAALDVLIAEWQPVAFVVGLPLQANGQAQKMTRRARNFAQEIGGRYKLPVHAVDERYTTIEATHRLQAARASGSRGRRLRRGDVDAMAAQTLLESWLSGELEEMA